MTCKVSVTIPCYNSEEYIREALDSVLEQTYADYEILVVDDCSTDSSWQILQNYAIENPCIRIFRNDTNLGIPKTRNRLLQEVPPDTEFIAILDSDDVMEKTRIEKQVTYLEAHKDIGLVGSWVSLISSDGGDLGEREYPCGAKAIRKTLLSTNPVAQPAVMLRHTVARGIGPYDEKLSRVQDLDYWARAIKKGYKINNIQESLTRYRIHKDEGQFGRNKENLWFAFLVRAKHIFSSSLFTFRGLLITMGYLVAIVIPPKMVQKVAKRFYYDA